MGIRSMAVCGAVAVSCLANCTGDDGDGAVGSECVVAPDDCAGDSVCIGGRCEPAFGRLYDVTSVSVELPTTDTGGASWDVGGGAPDIFVEFSVNGSNAGRSSTVDDAFSATFAGPFTLQPVGGASFEMRVFDEDVTVDDLAFTCAATPLSADLLRSRVLRCSSAGYVAMFRIDPH